MRISGFLPHVGVFGGVRRFLELGNAWAAMGHSFTLFHPGGEQPEWLPFAGEVRPLADAAALCSDFALCADPHTLDAFVAHEAHARFYYCVIEGDPGVERALAAGVPLSANSGPLRGRLHRRYKVPVADGVGGINPAQFRPGPAGPRGDPLRVLLNGRRSRPKKGTDLVLKALDGLRGRVPPFEAVLFDTVGEHNRQDPRDEGPLPGWARVVLNPTQQELVGLYRSSDLFVAAERKAGWCNTAIEAMACGTPVVCTPSGTRDFARDGENALVVPIRHAFFLSGAIARALRDPALRRRLGAAGPASVQPWTWERLAAKLLAQAGLEAESETAAP